jgi:hypothetical protein
MNFRIFSASAIAVLIIIASLISGQAISGETTDTSLILASTTNTFEGILVVKEGHGDILVRSEDGHQRGLKVKQSTAITRNGKPAAFGDLQVRDQVHVSYDANRVVVELDASGS